MFKKLIIISLLGWQTLAYSLSNRLYVAGYGGFSKPKYTLGDLTKDITKGKVVGLGSHFQVMKYLVIEFNILPFWGTVIERSSNIETHYKTVLGGGIAKPIFQTPYRFLKIYGAVGAWGIRSYNRNKNVDNSEKENISSPQGYGIGLGAGFNWVFYPRFSRKLALDVSGMYCFPFPNNNKNYIKTGFPLFKAGLGYHFL